MYTTSMYNNIQIRIRVAGTVLPPRVLHEHNMTMYIL